MKYLKQFSLYTFVGFFNAGLSFLLMPYLSYYINPEGYGILAMVNSFVTIIIPLIGLTASGLITVEYYKLKDRAQFASLFSSIQAIPVLPAIFFLGICLLFQHRFSDFLEIPRSKGYWVSLSVIIAFFSIYYETLLSYLIIAQKPNIYVKYSLIRVLSEVGLTLVFISLFGMNWEGRLLSWTISILLSFSLSFFYFRAEGLLTINIKKQSVYAGVLFGLPLILHTIGKFIINQSDRIFIAKMISIEDAGVYNIGYQVGMIIMLLVTAVASFFQPFLFERLADLHEKAKLEIVKLTYIIIIGLFVALIVLSLGSPLLFNYLINKSYKGGEVFVFWTGLSYVFWGIYMLFAGYIFFRRKTRILGYFSLVNVILNIILNYVMIKAFGALGAVYATCISFLVLSVMIFIQVNSMYKLPWFRFKEILNVKIVR